MSKQENYSLPRIEGGAGNKESDAITRVGEGDSSFMQELKEVPSKRVTSS